MFRTAGLVVVLRMNLPRANRRRRRRVFGVIEVIYRKKKFSEIDLAAERKNCLALFT
jgi:hypothetical protein